MPECNEIKARDMINYYLISLLYFTRFIIHCTAFKFKFEYAAELAMEHFMLQYFNISICIIDKYFDFINLNLSLEITQSNVYDCQLCKLELHLKNCQSNDQTKSV